MSATNAKPSTVSWNYFINKFDIMGLFSSMFDKLKPYQPKSTLYKLLFRLSGATVSSVSALKFGKAQVEAILFFIAFCKVSSEHRPYTSTEILKPLVTEVLDHIEHDKYLDSDRRKNLVFVNSRIELYNDEILKTFINNQDKTYYGGVIAYNFIEHPLTLTPNRSSDLFKQMELISIINGCFKTLFTFLVQNYDLKEVATSGSEKDYNQVCPLCGSKCDLTDLTKVSMDDDDDVGRVTMYACSFCVDRYSLTDETFRIEK